MAERITPPAPLAPADELDAMSPPELLGELHRRDEEILRLRDLLIGRDAELGAARGQLAMLEENSRRLTGIAARVPIPGAARIISGMLRLLQGRRG